MQRNSLEIAVGLFVLFGLIALVLLAFEVSGLNQTFTRNSGYEIKAYFPNIGSLKPRSKVTVAGVNVGRVKDIILDPQTYEAEVIVFIDSDIKIPKDSSASILTAGLIGDNYLSIDPGLEEEYFVDGGVVAKTHSALVLEELVSRFLFNKASQ